MTQAGPVRSTSPVNCGVSPTRPASRQAASRQAVRAAPLSARPFPATNRWLCTCTIPPALAFPSPIVICMDLTPLPLRPLIPRNSKIGGGSLAAGRARPQHNPRALRCPDGPRRSPCCEATVRHPSPGLCTANPTHEPVPAHVQHPICCRPSLAYSHMYGLDPIASI